MCCATNLYSFRLWQFLGSLFSKICVENSNSNEVQFDKTTFILLSIAKSNITLRGYKLQTLPKMSTRLFFVARKQWIKYIEGVHFFTHSSYRARGREKRRTKDSNNFWSCVKYTVFKVWKPMSFVNSSCVKAWVQNLKPQNV